MQNEIMVSINCITYNHEKYIAEAIESFLMQKTKFKYEILIHDDASTDGTAKIIREYQSKYPDIIKPILQVENQYSQGIKRIDYTFNHTRAKGKYIAFCEGDDYWFDPMKLQKQVDYMESNPNCTLCMHAVKTVNSETNKCLGFIRPKRHNEKCDINEVISGGGGYVGTNSLLFPKKALDNPPAWYFNAPVGDYPMQIYLTSEGYAYYMNEVMSVYRVGVPGSWTTINSSSIDEITKQLDSIGVMLDELNKAANNIYNKAIESKKKKDDFAIMLMQRKYREIRKSEFSEYYLSLNARKRIMLYIEQLSPQIATALINIKRRLIK